MKKAFKLAKVLFKSSLRIKESGDKKKITRKTVLYIVLLACIAPLLYFLYDAGSLAYALFESHNENDLFIGAVLFVASLIIFVSGIAGCMSSFYYSEKNEVLFALPLCPAQISGAKLIVAILYEYYLSFIILAPLLIGYGVAAEKTLVFWIGVVFAIILLPIVPMAYAGIVAIVFMRIFRGARKSGKLQIISAIGIFLFTIIITIVSSGTEKMSVKSLEDMVLHFSKTLEKLTRVFADIPFLSDALTKESLLPLLISVVATALVLAVFYLVARLMYFQSAIGNGEKANTKKSLDADRISKEIRSRDIVGSYTIKELRMVIRDPACFMQCLLLSLGWPILIVITEIISKKAASEINMIEKMITMVGNDTVGFIYILFGVVFGVTLFTTAFNAIAPTAISREGKGFMFMKQFPVSYKKQLKAKRNASLVVCGIGNSFYIILAGVLLIIFEGFPWWGVLLGLAINCFLLIIMIDIGMIIGLMRVKIDWESESDILGKNIIGVVMLFIGGAVGVCLGIFFTDVSKISMNPLLFTALLLVCLAVLAFVIERVFYSLGERKLDSLH